MNLKELYEELDSDYAAVLGRFMGNETLIKRFLPKFRAESCYHELMAAIEQDDRKTAEDKVHALKGVAGNLGFDKLFAASRDMLAKVRDKDWEGGKEAFEVVRTEYDKVMRVLDEWEQGQ